MCGKKAIKNCSMINVFYGEIDISTYHIVKTDKNQENWLASWCIRGHSSPEQVINSFLVEKNVFVRSYVENYICIFNK